VTSNLDRAAGRQGTRWRPGRAEQGGRWGYALGWLLGVPAPLLLLVYLLRGGE
jgi:hypothetical protein